MSVARSPERFYTACQTGNLFNLCDSHTQFWCRAGRRCYGHICGLDSTKAFTIAHENNRVDIMEKLYYMFNIPAEILTGLGYKPQNNEILTYNDKLTKL